MGVQIYIPAQDVWFFFQENRERLKDEMLVIAENTETGYAIYLDEEYEKPHFSICKDEEVEQEEYAINEYDCLDTVKTIFLNFLYPITVKDDEEDYYDDEDYMDIEDEQYIRDDQLRIAMVDFLDAALDGCSTNFYDDDFVEDVTDHILRYLATEYGLDIYRPMVFTDEETNEKICVRYPYNDDLDEDFYDIDDYEGSSD